MRSLILFLALLLCTSASATPIPSDASGVYLGTDRVCRVVLSRYQAQWIQADVACLSFSGAYTVSLTTLYAPGSGACWPNQLAIDLKPWAPNEYVALRVWDATDQKLLIVRGTDPNAVANGSGITEAWRRIGYAPSLAPFSCAAQVFSKPRG
jgi:hypothetical protein